MLWYLSIMGLYKAKVLALSSNEFEGSPGLKVSGGVPDGEMFYQ